MNLQRFKTTMMILAAGVMLCGCKPSDEKLAEAESARNTLVEHMNMTEEKYLDITEDTKRAELDELAAQVQEVQAVNFNKMSNKKIDEYLPTVTELTGKYDQLLNELGVVFEDEEAARIEASKHLEVEAYVVNKTGVNLTAVKLHDVSRDVYSENIIGDGVTLTDGYTLMGVILELYTDSKEWEFVATDENGKELILSCPGLSENNSDGMSITLKYDTESGEGTADIGSYVKEEETENADASASAGSSAESSADSASEGDSK